MGNYGVQDAFVKFYPEYRRKHTVTPEQESAAQCIMGCKTGQYGFTKSVCPSCGYEQIHYASCGNRNCPCCQGTKPAEWVEARSSELIEGVPYYHVIMTVPHELNPLFLSNQKGMYRLLMQSASDSMVEVAQREENIGGTPGVVAVMHTWGQTLELHPHVHMLVTGGGLSSPIEFGQKGLRSEFLCPQEHLAGAFRQRFLDGLKKLRSSDSLSFNGSAEPLRNSYSWEELLTKLYRTQWNVHIKETFNDNGNAVEYLSRYAYRTAISNSRVLSVSDDGVTISYKDYRDGQKKTMLLSGEEFIRRFLLHVLPKGFSRIRYSGFLSNSRKKKCLAMIRRLKRAKERVNRLAGMTARQRIFALFNVDICECPKCHKHMNMYRLNKVSLQC